jgi:hypothetical protein
MHLPGTWVGHWARAFTWHGARAWKPIRPLGTVLGPSGHLPNPARCSVPGSAAAVALAPRVIAGNGVGALSVALVTVLVAAMVVTGAWHRGRSTLPGTGPAAHPG